MNPHSTLVLTGIDDGQGFCKVGALFVDREKEENKLVRSKYSEGFAPKSFKPSSVKKLLVLGIIPEVPENHPNMETLLGELKMEAIEFSVSTDIKMLNCLVGKSSGQPKFGCPFCNTGSPYALGDYELYSLGDLEDWHQKFI